jgi:hypothetical protein
MKMYDPLGLEQARVSNPLRRNRLKNMKSSGVFRCLKK